MSNTCTVCGFNGLEEPPVNYTICPSCGTEFGYTDFMRSHEELRQRWEEGGLQWCSTVIPQPPKWNGFKQLLDAGFIEHKFTAHESKPSISMVDFGEEIIHVSSPSLSGNLKTRVVAIMGRSIQYLPYISPSHAEA